MLVYKKILKQKKLVKYWLFFSCFKKTVRSNYVLLKSSHTHGYCGSLSLLVYGIQKLIPVFNITNKGGGQFSFISMRHVYTTKVLYKKSYRFLKNIKAIRLGIFSNAGMQKPIQKNPSLALFFSQRKDDYLLEEARLKNIPTIALVSTKGNPSLVDYPLCVNSIYFHTVYFFAYFFIKFLVYGINSKL
jgi:hypothetical protein